MKLTLICVVISITAAYCNAQLKLTDKDLSNLISLAELYSANPNAAGEDFARSITALRTPPLNHVIDTLVAVGKGDKSILENRFLSRPSDDDLRLWYVLREIHYNRTDETKTSKTSDEVARDVLSRKIDSRWLLDNYYYRIHGGIALLFNTADLSRYDLNLDALGLRDETEKAIVFLNLIDSLAGGRFRVLMMTKNDKKLLEFASRLPKFNGKPYYFYKGFDYDDFEWIGYAKTESYNGRMINDLYGALLAHYLAATNLLGKEAGQEIYRNSILNEPKYFRFCEAGDILQNLYTKSK